MFSTPKPKPSPASPKAPEHKRPSLIPGAADAGFARVPFADGHALACPFLFSEVLVPLNPLHEAKAQVSLEILQSHAGTHGFEPGMGDRPHPLRRPKGLGNPRHAQSTRRNQRLRLSHLSLPPRTRHRKTRRLRPRGTPAHPQRRPLLPPLVRPFQLLHPQVDLRSGRQCKKSRSPRPPRRTSCRTIALHHGSRTRASTHSKTCLRLRSSRLQ